MTYGTTTKPFCLPYFQLIKSAKEINMAWYSNTVLIHSLIGALALLTFWTAGLSKKGSLLHKSAGKIYLLAMTGIVLTALPISIAMLTNGNPIAGAFFSYLVVITSTSIWVSWRAIRDKQNWQRFTGPVYQCLMVLNLLSGLTIAALGLFYAKDMQLVISSFSLIGIFSAMKMYRFQKTAPTDSRWWLREHLSAMIGNGVATHIAFLSIGLPKILPMLAGPVLQNAAWIGPLTLSIFIGMYLKRKYVPTRTKSPATASTAKPNN
jgi:uncharacterized membrane protein